MRNYLPVPYSEVNLKLSKTSLFIYLLGVGMILSVYLQPYIPVEQLTRDTVAVAKGKFYYGIVSNIGLFLWCATASVCFFTYLMIKKGSHPRQQRMVLFGALISSVLLLDDDLMLHEEVFPKYLHLSENYILILYPLMLVSFILYFLKEILLSQALLYFSALGCLALSMVSDKIFPQKGYFFIIEDDFKLLGIMGWTTYFCHVCLEFFEQNFKLMKAAHTENGEPGLSTQHLPIVEEEVLSF